MREIKFRAYIPNTQQMVEVKSLHLGTQKIMYGYSNNSQSYGNRTTSFEDCLLMQYIGFEDNNGKKIYEGDIINIDYGEVIVKAVVEYCGASFFGSTNADNWDLNEYHKIEVLGNIYENPELMED